MKNIYYILRDELDRAAGDARPRVRGRGMTVGAGKIVDMEAWKAENLIVPDGPEARRVSAFRQYGGREPVRRHRRAAAIQNWVELAATLAVTAAFVALAARVLLF